MQILTINTHFRHAKGFEKLRNHRIVERQRLLQHFNHLAFFSNKQTAYECKTVRFLLLWCHFRYDLQLDIKSITDWLFATETLSKCCGRLASASAFNTSTYTVDAPIASTIRLLVSSTVAIWSSVAIILSIRPRVACAIAILPYSDRADINCSVSSSPSF